MPLGARFGYDDGDVDTNRSGNPHLNTLIETRYSRRQTLMGGLSAMTTAVFGGVLLAGCDDNDPPPSNMTVVDGQTLSASAAPPPGAAAAGDSGGLLFSAVAKNRDDLVTVPAGYDVTVLYRFGDPIAAGVGVFANDGSDKDYDKRAGDDHDGMSFFGLTGANTPDPNNSRRGLLVLNHENINQQYLHADGPTENGGARPRAEVIKEIDCHGVSVIEVSRGASGWSYDQSSALNRRITPNTPMTIRGPARGDPAMRTAYSPDGTSARGTLNNCADGYTPWYTYLTNEENWAGYFRRDRGDAAARTARGDAKQNISFARYGIPQGEDGNYGWSTAKPSDPADTRFRRWNATAESGVSPSADFSSEPFQFGWVVEIDPYDPASTPRKRTALGRINHEGCYPGRAIAGTRPAFYMGDDSQGEYIYKFVSATPWSSADAGSPNRLAIGDKYLDTGTLYVARFDVDGTGRWLALVFGQGPLTPDNPIYPFADQADVLINARIAADLLGATGMDRPEWTAVNPANGEMYCTLTNNSSRTPSTADAANPRAYVDRNTNSGSRRGNANGHVIRLREDGDTTEATRFEWDVYAFGAGADLDPFNVNLSDLNGSNDFSSPDGISFSVPPNAPEQLAVMWLRTDDGAYTDVTNCMLLAAIPGRVGDGGPETVLNVLGGERSRVTTRVGEAPGARLRRFLVGPRECEITGVSSTPDGRSLFVNIQHPGEDGDPENMSSNWPDGQFGGNRRARPRSAVIVVTRRDGGLIGL